MEQRAADLEQLRLSDPEGFRQMKIRHDDERRLAGEKTADECTEIFRQAATKIKAFHNARLTASEAKSQWKETKHPSKDARLAAKTHFESCDTARRTARSEATEAYRPALALGRNLVVQALGVLDGSEISAAGTATTTAKYGDTLVLLDAETSSASGRLVRRFVASASGSKK